VAHKLEVLARETISGIRDLESAEVIVSGGRGLRKKEDFALLRELAEVLGGEVGCTRPIAVDNKWFADWVGLSGHKVKPKLYIACGISGAVQQLAGIRDSKLIIAINNDPEAPIFEAADYGVVGDLYEVVPALTARLREAKK
jgi:electron transfer flavoprotein alpha subunit